jgi:hypothetical protein
MPPEGRNAAYFRDIVDAARAICDFTNTVSLAAEVVLMKDRGGRVNRHRELGFSVPESDSLRIALEAAPS